MEKPQNYLSRLRRHPLLWNLALIAAIILAMAVAAHILMQLGTRHGARRTVPDLSGVQLDQAQRIARKHDLQLHINDSLFVPAYEGGIVLDQLPEGGVEVKPGRTVYITINSSRQKMVPVPYVAGRSLRQAKNMLEIAGLEIAELVYRADMATNYVLEEYCEGKPVTPTTRMEAEMGSGVTLYVGVEEGYGTTIVPRLVGLPLAQAKVHFLVIPKKHIPSAAALTEEDGALLGHVFAVIAKLAKEQGLDNGYRVISNVGEDAGQTVKHLHFHVLGGEKLPV